MTFTVTLPDGTTRTRKSANREYTKVSYIAHTAAGDTTENWAGAVAKAGTYTVIAWHGAGKAVWSGHHRDIRPGDRLAHSTAVVAS